MVGVVPILFVGDIHGSMRDFESAVRMAVRNGIRTVVQVGDFWLYDTERDVAKMDRVIRRLHKERNIPADGFRFIFIDGNHENFSSTNPLSLPHRMADAIDSGVDVYEGGVSVTDFVTWAPRGSVMTLEGFTVGFLGGATSHDQHLRTEGKDWFPEESITLDDLNVAFRNMSTGVDILVTHETSTAGFAALRENHPALSLPATPSMDAVYIDRLLSSTRPAAHIHGHYHVADKQVMPNRLSISLSRNSHPGAFAVLGSDGRAVSSAALLVENSSARDYLL